MSRSPVARDRAIAGFFALPVLLGSFVSALIAPDAELYAQQFWLVDLLTFVILPLLGLIGIHVFTEIRPSQYGLGKLSDELTLGSSLLQIILALLAFALFTPIAAVVVYAGNVAAPTLKGGYFSELLAGPFGSYARLYLAASAALSEEIFFRGVLGVVLLGRDRSDRILYVLLSSGLFALAHFNQGAHVMCAAAFTGLISALIYLRWRHLWFLIVAHFLVGYVSY